MIPRLSITRKQFLRNWPLLLLVLLLVILVLHKYIFPLSPYYPQPVHRKVVTLYSNPTYYNAILPWLSLNHKQRRFHLEQKTWINLSRLQFQIRHGQGEFWITSLEGAVQAWSHGADLKILMIMGWRRWNVISSLSEEELHARKEQDIYYPQYSTSIRNILREILKEQKVTYTPMELPRLLEKLQSRQIDTALLQTPLATYVQMKEPKLKTSIPLEQLYTEQTGTVTRFPWIVLAVRNQWAQENSKLVGYIQKKLRQEAYMLNLIPIRDVISLWDKRYHSDIPPDLLEKLLQKEKLQSIPAEEAEEQIKLLLKLTLPHIKYSEDLLWRS